MSISFAHDKGLVQVPSRSSFSGTAQRLRDGIAQRGLKLFAVIDHSGEAAAAGLSMPPTQVFIFGSPKAGTPWMVASPSLALDLPLKVLLAEDANGAVTLTYSTAEFLVARHGLAPDAAKALGGAAALATEAAG